MWEEEMFKVRSSSASLRTSESEASTLAGGEDPFGKIDELVNAALLVGGKLTKRKQRNLVLKSG